MAITRQPGPPARAGIFLLNAAATTDADNQVADNELVLLPAEVLPDSVLPDPSGRCVAFVTQATAVRGGNNLISSSGSCNCSTVASSATSLTSARPQVPQLARQLPGRQPRTHTIGMQQLKLYAFRLRE